MSDWWTDPDLYDLYETGLDGDIEFYVEEAKKAQGEVLEVGCGTGRILIPIAQAGISITGLDISPSMLKKAREKISHLEEPIRSRITLVEGDMRSFSFSKKFKLCIIPYRGFLHMITPDDQIEALCNIRYHLSEGGILILDIFDPRLDWIVRYSSLQAGLVKLEDELVNPKSGQKIIVWCTRKYDLENQVLEEFDIFEEIDKDGCSKARNFRKLRLRWIYRYEMEYLLKLCGYKILALYGDFYRSPFRYGGEQIWIAQKGGEA